MRKTQDFIIDLSILALDNNEYSHAINYFHSSLTKCVSLHDEIFFSKNKNTSTLRTSNQGQFSSCHFNTPCNNLIYFMDSLRISLLLNFLSDGCVGSSRRNSANAPLTFCCLNFKLVKAIYISHLDFGTE